MRDADFERLFAEHSQPLFGFLVYRTGNRAAAEDLLSETFERVLRARRRFDPRKGSEKAWIYQIALNCLRDQRRRDDAESRAVERVAAGSGGEAADSTAGIPDRLDSRALVARGMEALNEDEREAIALRFGAELTVPEIARVTGEPLSRVEGRVYRGLRKLRDSIEG
jgi:RNA polymerase sigma factor (sigma-70 family)